MNPTTDPALRSWLAVTADSHFPIQNLPYGVFRRGTEAHAGVAIGEQILDLTVLEQRGVLGTNGLFQAGTLNEFLSRGKATWSPIRQTVSRLLSANESSLRDNADLKSAALIPQPQSMLVPATIGDYTDFYSSREHATNVGTMLRGPDNALMPNWLHLPVAYHGRSSSVVISGTEVRRPKGQSMPQGATTPVFGPSKSLDFELEMAAFVGPGNDLGRPIPIG